MRHTSKSGQRHLSGFCIASAHAIELDLPYNKFWEPLERVDGARSAPPSVLFTRSHSSLGLNLGGLESLTAESAREACSSAMEICREISQNM